ncbi:MAG TPA: hypothetical protein PK253_12880 [Spirochaetota bacterium]|nr:hypothetical protein [Spirochaetota bacterium]
MECVDGAVDGICNSECEGTAPECDGLEPGKNYLAIGGKFRCTDSCDLSYCSGVQQYLDLDGLCDSSCSSSVDDWCDGLNNEGYCSSCVVECVDDNDILFSDTKKIICAFSDFDLRVEELSGSAPSCDISLVRFLGSSVRVIDKPINIFSKEIEFVESNLDSTCFYRFNKK